MTDKQLTDQPVKKSWVKFRRLAAVIAAIAIVAVSIVAYQNRYPTAKIKQLIQQGDQAESEYQFQNAIENYQSALRLNDYDQQLRYQALVKLAIVYARNAKPQEAAKTIETINQEFPTKETTNAKLELAILAGTQVVDSDRYQRGLELRNILERTEDLTLNDQNNFLSLSIRYSVLMDYPKSYELRKEFAKILDEDPDHFEANYNLYRIARNAHGTRREKIEETKLAKCLAIKTDPHLIKMQLRNMSIDVNSGVASTKDYEKLLEQYAKSGGTKATAKMFSYVVKNQKDRADLIRAIGSMRFNDRAADLFVFYGVANPIPFDKL